MSGLTRREETVLAAVRARSKNMAAVTCRELAAEIGVSHVTAWRVVRRLEDRGLLRARFGVIEIIEGKESE